MGAITPVSLLCVDGQERKFLLSMGGVRRLKQKLGSKTLQEVLQRDIEEAGIPILYEALLDRGELTEEQFADLLPSDLPTLLDAIMTLLDRSYPAKKQRAEAAANPTPASPTIQ